MEPLTRLLPTHQQVMQPLEDRERVSKIQDGSYTVFEDLFHEYYADLVAFVRHYVHTPEVAEGLVQDIFFNIWKNRQSWHPRGTLRAYLYGAARNHSLKHRRRQKTRRRLQAQLEIWKEGVGSDPESGYQFQEFSRAVQRAIEDLPERRRLIFNLSRQQGLTYAEIAAVLGLSINTVENQMVRALKTLRRRLACYLSADQEVDSDLV